MTRRRARATRGAVLATLTAILVSGCSSSGDATSAAGKRAEARAPSSSTYVLPSCPELPHRPVRAGGLPDLQLPCLGTGPAVRLSDLRGTPTVLNVWAAWCTICDEEMPVLGAAMRRAGDRVRFFGIHYKAPAGFGRRSAADFGVPFPSVQDTDGDRTTLALKVGGPPTTLFYAADGELAGRHAGVITSRGEMQELMQRYLGVDL